VTKVLVTGATGFVGRPLCEILTQLGYEVRAAVRSGRPLPAAVGESVVVGSIGANTSWDEALEGVDSVLHLAATAHIVHDASRHEQLYFDTNERGTRSLAEAAARHGVRRFLYLSSIKVNGEGSGDHAYSPSDPPSPQDAYGVSKWRGEQALQEVAGRSGLEAVIVRSPLVYGPGVRANFLRLMQWVERERPLPLGAVNNRRSIVYVRNLCDLLARLLSHPAAPRHTWMVADERDLSTPDLIRSIGKAMDRPVHLLKVPLPLLRLGGRLLNRAAEIDRLCGSLTVDSELTRRELRWSPPVSTADALEQTVNWFMSENSPGVARS